MVLARGNFSIEVLGDGSSTSFDFDLKKLASLPSDSGLVLSIPDIASVYSCLLTRTGFSSISATGSITEGHYLHVDAASAMGNLDAWTLTVYFFYYVN